ncbi:MAG TPA: ROK family transcriptional regulator [candidate division Zixibacteria bacterium]|nr:ROK family transcriptional regulator [candidate division Zixibacteria bacterium]HER00452.1 ROK family transcriptional regulator [candidate division Zixibacteria bacterium]
MKVKLTLSNSSGKRAVLSRERPLANSVLKLIWEKKKTSRAEIARLAGLSRSTVSEIIDSILTTGLIAEVGAGKSRGGRRPIVLEFQDEARWILGVDLGATHVSVALTDLRGRVLSWQEKKHPVRTDPRGTRELVISLCDECLKEWGNGTRRLNSIGVAVPSPVDPLNPRLLSEVVIPAWQGESGLEQLQIRYGVPVYVDNDANLGALAEHWWGAGKGINDFVYIKIAHGIGAGYILNGEIYRGAGGVAGEMGHLPIDPNGPLCVCGLRGCLATFVGKPAIAERTKKLLKKYPGSQLKGQDHTLDAITKAALDGDALALKIVSEVAEYLGVAISGWFNLMNPNLAILGGGFAGLGELLLEPLRAKVRNSTLVSKAAVDIKTSDLGPRAVAIGAATLALEAMFADPIEVHTRANGRINDSVHG